MPFCGITGREAASARSSSNWAFERSPWERGQSACRSLNPGVIRLGLRSLLDAIEQHEHQDAQDGIRNTRQKFMRPTPLHVQSHHAAANQEVDNLVYHIKENRQQETS